MPLSIWIRFVIYGFVGCGFEIFFTGIKNWIASGYNDWSLQGKSYIWMFPIYGLLTFLFEPVHDLLRPWPWPLRGVIYVAGFYVVEFTTGWLLKVITGKCPWDYTGKKFSFMGFIRWDYAPIWFGFCLAIEPLHDLLLRVKLA